MRALGTNLDAPHLVDCGQKKRKGKSKGKKKKGKGKERERKRKGKKEKKEKPASMPGSPSNSILIGALRSSAGWADSSLNESSNNRSRFTLNLNDPYVRPDCEEIRKEKENKREKERKGKGKRRKGGNLFLARASS